MRSQSSNLKERPAEEDAEEANEGDPSLTMSAQARFFLLRSTRIQEDAGAGAWSWLLLLLHVSSRSNLSLSLNACAQEEDVGQAGQRGSVTTSAQARFVCCSVTSSQEDAEEDEEDEEGESWSSPLTGSNLLQTIPRNVSNRFFCSRKASEGGVVTYW